MHHTISSRGPEKRNGLHTLILADRPATGESGRVRPTGLGPHSLGPRETLSLRTATLQLRETLKTLAPFTKAPAELASVTLPRTHRGNDSPGPSRQGEP